jgi:hypothetical protein
VVRVETSFSDVDPGIIIPQKPLQQTLTANFTTTLATLQPSNLFIYANPGEVWDLVFNGTCGCSTVNGIQLGIVAPTGTTVDGAAYSSSGAINTRTYNVVSTINAGIQTVHTVAGGLRDDQLFVRAKIGATGGNLGIGMRAVTAGNTATMAAKSSLIATRVTEV